MKRIVDWGWLHKERHLDGNYRQKEYDEVIPEAQTVFDSELHVIKCYMKKAYSW